MTQGRSSSWAAQPLLVSETMGKALAAEVTPCAAGCGAVSGHPISAGYKTGRFRRQGAGAAPISAGARAGFVSEVQWNVATFFRMHHWRVEEDRPSPSCAAGCGTGDIGVCCLCSGLLHRSPPMHRTGTQGCAPVLYTHCCRRSPRQIRGHICILNCFKKAAQDAVSKHPSYIMNIAVCRGIP